MTPGDTALLLYMDSDAVLTLATEAARLALAGAPAETAAREALTRHLEGRASFLVDAAMYSDDARIWRDTQKEADRLRSFATRLRRQGNGA